MFNQLIYTSFYLGSFKFNACASSCRREVFFLTLLSQRESSLKRKEEYASEGIRRTPLEIYTSGKYSAEVNCGTMLKRIRETPQRHSTEKT